MEEHRGVYAPRAVEARVMAHIDRVRSDATLPFSVAALMGAPGHGVKNVLTRGIAPRLAADPMFDAVQVFGAWDRDAAIQYCVDEIDIPELPPPPHSPVRLLLIASTDLSALPEWLTFDGPPEVRNFPVTRLSLSETQGFLDAQLAGPVDLSTVNTLGVLTGFVPGLLTPLVDECRDSGALRQISGLWQLVGDPVQFAVLPYLRSQTATAPPEEARSLFRIALAEPVLLEYLEAADQGLANRLLLDGQLQRRVDGALEFCSPALAQALRALGPTQDQDQIFGRVLRSAHPSLPSIQWAVQKNLPVPTWALERLSSSASNQHDWKTTTLIAELAQCAHFVVDAEHRGHSSLRGRGTWNQLSQAMLADLCLIELNAAAAARFLGDAQTAYSHLQHIETSLAPALSPRDAALIRAKARTIRAELSHYLDHDLESALEALNLTESVVTVVSEAHAELLGHTVLHLVAGAQISEAKRILHESQHILEQASQHTQTRVAIATSRAHLAAGAPLRALRDLTQLASQSVPLTMPDPGLDEEIRSAYFFAALGSYGPTDFSGLDVQLVDTRDGRYHFDVMGVYFALASWEFVRGNISESHRLGERALRSVDLPDPFGFTSALTALVSETAALTGEYERADVLTERLRHFAVTTGSTKAHLSAALMLRSRFHIGSDQRVTPDYFHENAQYGFAAEVMYAGVRLGRRRAARELQVIANKLDGELHGMRVSHAVALRARDPVALIEVSDRLHDAGLRLFAAEAAAAAWSESAPDSVRRRAHARVSTLLEEESLPGHELLQRIVRPAIGHTPLTPREREIAALIAQGLTNTEIAERLHLSPRTVEGHIGRLYRKTGAEKRAPSRQSRLA